MRSLSIKDKPLRSHCLCHELALCRLGCLSRESNKTLTKMMMSAEGEKEASKSRAQGDALMSDAAPRLKQELSHCSGGGPPPLVPKTFWENYLETLVKVPGGHFCYYLAGQSNNKGLTLKLQSIMV